MYQIQLVGNIAKVRNKRKTTENYPTDEMMTKNHPEDGDLDQFGPSDSISGLTFTIRVDTDVEQNGSQMGGSVSRPQENYMGHMFKRIFRPSRPDSRLKHLL